MEGQVKSSNIKQTRFKQAYNGLPGRWRIQRCSRKVCWRIRNRSWVLIRNQKAKLRIINYVEYLAKVDLEDISERMKIRNAIQQGQIEQGIEYINDLDPEVGVFILPLCFSSSTKLATLLLNYRYWTPIHSWFSVWSNNNWSKWSEREKLKRHLCLLRKKLPLVVWNR